MTHIYGVYKRFTSDKRPTQTESEKLEKNIPNSGQEKNARVAILVSDKIDFK